MRGIKISILFLILVFWQFSFAQKEANIWYFGNHSGLDFNTDPPGILTNGKLNSIEGSGSIADSTGNLLFYSQGDTIWNKNHQIMENGIGLSHKYSESSPSAALIVRQPLNNRYYYVFNSGERAYLGDVFYSVVDIEANNGNGKVIIKRRLMVNRSAEKIALVQHANKKDIWIAIKQGTSDTLFVFLLTENGLSTTVLKYNTYLESYGTGQMKFSPNGKYLACGNIGNQLGDSCCYLYHFDIHSGNISKQRKIHVRSYGIEFSPNSKYLYCHAGYGKQGLFQCPIKNIKTDFWPDSSCFYINFPIKVGSLQLASNGKIYGNSIDTFLRVINLPNQKGAKCNYETNGQKISVFYNFNGVSIGLPSFIASYFKSQSFSYTNKCINEPTHFLLLDSLDNDSVKWDFGDTLSHEKNFSNKSHDVSHVYTRYGVFKVKLITYYDNRSDTNMTVVSFLNPKPDFAASDICEKDTVRFFDKSSVSAGKLDLNWKFGDGQNSNLRSPSHFYKIEGVSKTYNVTLVTTMTNGCADSITKAINVHANPVSDFYFTIHQKTVDFKSVQLGNTSYKWHLGNGDSASTEDLSYTYSKPGNYNVCLKVTNAAQCFSQTCKKVAVTIGISDFKRKIDYKIYPNPSHGMFEIESINPSKNIEVQVFNSVGMQIPTNIDLKNGNSKHFTLSMEVNTGIYLLKIVNDSEVYFQKVIIMR